MPAPTESLSLSQARRVALAAQGFADPPPTGRVDRRHLRRVLGRTSVLQIDSVNVVARAQYVPVFSRLGPYPMPLLDTMAYDDGELFEYWAHEAALAPVAWHPLFRWRMARARRGEMWGGIARLGRERPEYIAHVRSELERRGPLRPADLREQPRGPRTEMWDWDDEKRALEWLFWAGEVAVRRRSFQRYYDLAERVLPPAVLDAPTPSDADAHRELLRIAARSHGVGTAADLADYFRLKLPAARPRLAELVEAGDLLEVTVEGWDQPAYLDPQARLPRWIRTQALLAPFDPVVWFRPRAERLFGFEYRIEIYVPPAKRIYGYYVLPFLLGDRLVARVDLKADRRDGRLLVRGAWAEDHADPAATASALAEELRSLARWLELDGVDVSTNGDLAPTLSAAIT
jgi:uncharacterized protein